MRLLIGICFGLTFMLGMLIFGPALLELLGGRGNVLANAIGYAQIFFGGAVLPWLMNTMAGVLRGTGNMKLPSLMILSSAVCQIILGGTLGLGLGPIPQFGMRGVAAGSLIAYSISISVMAWYLFSGRARVVPKIRGLRIQRAMFFDILKVGAVSCFSPLQSVLTISIFTHMLAGFGTAILAGYGIGARLEFMLTSVAFAVGIASVPMIGMAIGAERIARARRIAWTAGLVSFVSVGADRHVSSRSSPISGSISSPTIPACARPAGNICRRRRRCTRSSGWRCRCISPRRARPRCSGRCWRKARGCCSSRSAAGGCRRMTRPPRTSSRWPRPRWGARRAVGLQRCPDALGTEAPVRFRRLRPALS